MRCRALLTLTTTLLLIAGGGGAWAQTSAGRAGSQSTEPARVAAGPGGGQASSPLPAPAGALGVLLGVTTESAAGLEPNLLGPVVVTASRTPEPPQAVPATVHVLDDAALQRTPSVTLDGALRSVPGFSLFRRSDSLTANPTAQGVSLRGLGPSGASRSLVLLDGVPLNDPFGGWVAWTKLPRETAARAEVVPGGGATAWGNAALGGAIQIMTAPLRTERVLLDRPAAQGMWGSRGTARFSAALGDFETRSAELALTRPVGRGIVQLLARDFATDGFSLVAPEYRGPVDIAAWSRHRWITARWRQPVGAHTEFTTTARAYDEKRGNGTPYQRNGSREKFVSLALAGQPASAFAWQAVAYAQDQSFASTFSAVNATRTAENPASDQFAVPATALGGAWIGTFRHAGGARTSGGGDVRFVRGETRENFTFVNGAFTRQRVAGGRQLFSGVYGLHEQPLTTRLRTTFGARVDSWRDTHGLRRETDRATGAFLRDEAYPNRSGVELSPSAGAVWTPGDSWRLRANTQHAFRRPTLNELHRPFRVGPNVTEANAALRTERVTSAEIGAEWTLPGRAAAVSSAPPSASPAAPGPQRILTLAATTYWNELRDAVGNVTLVRGPGTFPLFGTIAAGGVGRQRLNLERTRVRGVELSGRWSPLNGFSATVDYLYNDARVRQAGVAPALVGNRVAQVPRHSASITAGWQAPARLLVAPRVRWIGRQFEDDENLLRLGEVVIADLGISRPLNERLELFVTIENLGNARIETGRSGNLVNVGTPRLALLGLRGAW
jgi:outer membrane receptor protein involved in Fe transport